MANQSAAHHQTTYFATLHRGWEVVHLEYQLTDDAIVVREFHLLGGKSEKRIALADLKKDARRIAARQPAYRYALILLQFFILVIAGDFALSMLTVPPRPIYAPVWWGAGAVIVTCLYVMLRTRRAKEWTFFPGVSDGKGLYILQDRSNAAAHKTFVDLISQRLGGTAIP